MISPARNSPAGHTAAAGLFLVVEEYFNIYMTVLNYPDFHLDHPIFTFDIFMVSSQNMQPIAIIINLSLTTMKFLCNLLVILPEQQIGIFIMLTAYSCS